jgi:hypothetical protein
MKQKDIKKHMCSKHTHNRCADAASRMYAPGGVFSKGDDGAASFDWASRARHLPACQNNESVVRRFKGLSGTNKRDDILSGLKGGARVAVVPL